jgi:hypothetical protein
MTRCDLMQHLAACDVTLRIEGDALRYRAPRGTMTPDLRAALVEYKPDVLHDYHERAAIMEFDGGLDRAEAERLAAEDVLNNATPETGRKVETR